MRAGDGDASIGHNPFGKEFDDTDGESPGGLPPFGAATPFLGVCPTDITRKKRVFADCPRTCHPVIYHHMALVLEPKLGTHVWYIPRESRWEQWSRRMGDTG